MSVQIEPEIHWDGRTLVGWVMIDGRRTMLCATREMVHSLSMYNDAIGWEIERHKSDIFERLIRYALLSASKAFLRNTYARTSLIVRTSRSPAARNSQFYQARPAACTCRG